MLYVLENNFLLFAACYIFGIIGWFLAGKLSSWKIRRSVRITIVILVIPIVWLGHPILVYQIWVLVLGLALQGSVEYVAGITVVWGVILWLAIRIGY